MTTSMRDVFVTSTTALLADDPRTSLVLADISASAFASAAAAHPDRVLNVGIREQLMIGVAGGLALTGLRPIVHSYAPFVVDRAYEQIKLDLDHQGVGAVLVSIGGSYDGSSMGRTHMSPGDVALFDTLTGWTVHVPGHPAEVPGLLRAAARHDEPVYLRLSSQSNRQPHGGLPLPTNGSSGGPHGDGRLRVIRRGGPGSPLVVAIGPMLDPVLAATSTFDLTVAYTHTVRPFDVAGLRALASTDAGPRASARSGADPRAPARTDAGPRASAEVVLVEPYLAGTSAAVVADALRGVPHRLLNLGVGRADLRRYGSPADHARWHGLDPAGLSGSIARFLADGPAVR